MFSPMKQTNLDEFYIKRINWLVGQGRDDLIAAIADDYHETQVDGAPTVMESVQARLTGCP